MATEKRILIVDDSATVRQLIRMVLGKRSGFAFSEAADGLQALDKLSKEVFDLLITDINMPNLDGLGLIRAVRGEMKSFLPIIIVTTRGLEKDRDRGMELGATAYVTKPVDATALLRTVETLLA